MPRLLFTAVNYWPEPTGTAPYTTKFAEHLGSIGHDVTVLTGMPHYPSWRVFPEYAGRSKVDEVRHGVRIIRRPHHVPRRQSAMERARYEGTFLMRGLKAGCSADAVIGIVPSLNGGLLARLKSSRARPYGVLFQDLMGLAAEQSGIKGGGAKVARVTRWAEKWAVARAAAVGTVSPSFVPYLKELGVAESRLVHTPNWPHLSVPELTVEEREKVRRNAGWPVGVQVALHAGNMGLKQGLEQIVAVARVAEDTGQPVHFVLLGDGNQRQALQNLASGLRQISFMESQPDDAYMNLLAAADVLLISERATSVGMSLPSKLTAYYVSGRPIVAVVPATGGTAAEVRRSGAGAVVPATDPDGLLDSLAELRISPALQKKASEAGPRYAARHLEAGAALKRLETFAELVLSARVN